MSLEAKLARLEAQSAARAREEKAHQKTRRREVMDRLDREHPDIAQHLRDIAATFGRPASVTVTTYDGEVILSPEMLRDGPAPK